MLIAALAVSIPLVAVVSKSSIGHAIADAIRHNSGADKGASTREQFEQLSAEMEQLRGDVDQARTELLEVHERLDFAERLLAKGREDAHQEGR
ncbi:MAG: hypothetical protein ABIZ70_00660 [Gemmatimonadales bacterium]